MTGATTGTADSDVVRTQSFAHDGPIDIDIAVASGRIDVVLDAATTGAGDGTHGSGTHGSGTHGSGTHGSGTHGSGTLGEPADGPGPARDHGSHTVPAPGHAPYGRPTGDDELHEAELHEAGNEIGHEAGPQDTSHDDGAAAPSAVPTDDGGRPEHDTGHHTGHDDDQPGGHATEAVVGAGPATRATSSGGVVVEVRRAPSLPDQWGVTGLLSWVGSQLGNQFGAQLGRFGDTDLVARAIRETEVSLHGDRLVVRAPKDPQLRSVALAVSVRAPGGSSVRSSSGSAQVAVDGPAGRVDIDTGSGRVRVESASQPIDIRTGSGAVLVGAARGGLAARGGSGDIQARSVAGEVTVESGSGHVELGTIDAGGVHVKTGSGHITVQDAVAGSLRLQAGSGMLTVGIHEGVDAELDVTSSSGELLNLLEVSDVPPSGDGSVGLRISGRTGSGTVCVRRAVDQQA